ncbi:MAG: zinc ribbon domain-containing protein [Anaerolineae bacterium]
MLPDTWLFGLLILALGTFLVFLVLLARILRRQPKRLAPTPPPPEVAPPVADDKAGRAPTLKPTAPSVPPTDTPVPPPTLAEPTPAPTTQMIVDKPVEPQTVVATNLLGLPLWAWAGIVGGGLLIVALLLIRGRSHRPSEPVYRCLKCGRKLDGPDAPCPTCGSAGTYTD